MKKLRHSLGRPSRSDFVQLEFVDVNWSAKYPFVKNIDEEEQEEVSETTTKSLKFEKLDVLVNKLTVIKDKIFELEQKIEYYYNKELFLKTALLDGGTFFVDMTGWGLPDSVKDDKYIFWNGKEGHISICQEEIDVTESAENLASFAESMRENNIFFLYVQYPCKMSGVDAEELPEGYESCADYNTDNFLKILDEKDVDYIDLRKEIVQSRQDMFSFFFRTDHHWKPSTGLWASGEIADYLSEAGFLIDVSIYDFSQYQVEKYDEVFLGSYGRAVTKELTVPDDFEMILPDFETKLNVWVPERNVSKMGTFSETLLDWQMLYPKPSYEIVQYSAYAWGDVGLMTVENLRADNDTKLLVVKDSFSNVVTPYLSLGVKELSIIDLRHFNGSLQTYVKEYSPDIVLVCYNPGVFEETGAINYQGHDSTMDFR